MKLILRNSQRLATSLAVATMMVVLGSCKTIDSKDFNKTIGAVVAGAGCAVISRTTGGDKQQTLAAAAVCAAVGYGVTKEMEKRRENFASDEQFYNSELARLEEYEQQLAGQIAEARSALAAAVKKADALRRSAQQSETDRNKLELLVKDLQTRKTALDVELNTAEENLKYQKGLIARMKETDGDISPQAQNELAQLENSVGELRELMGEHEQQTASLGVYL